MAGVGGLSAKTSLFSSTEITQQKKLETYWAEAGLGEKELFELISNSNCQSSEKYFLSCINSVVQTADDVQMMLSEETGLLENISQFNPVYEKTEREKLQAFVLMYAHQKNHQINFENLWAELLSQERSEKKSALIANGINSFLSVYKDPHTYILPNNYYEEVGSQLERSNLFVGVSFERIKKDILVRKVFKNSDADVAGLQSQDLIEEIDGIPVADLNLQKISQLLKIPEQKTFVFKIKRQAVAKKITIKRRYQGLNHVQFDILSGARNYALITLTKFNRGVCAEVSKQIKSASDKNITGLILDLRDNPGGQLDEAACLAGLFIGINKKIYSVEYFDPVKANEVVLTTGSLLYTGPMTILVNSSSASASELFAGALQEYKRAVVIGEKTFGKGTFQESEIWSKNNHITLFRTQGFYLLPSNFSTQRTGVNPDVEVSEPHVQLREESTYINPISNQKYDKSTHQKHSIFYEENLKKCALARKEFTTDDLILKKAVDILSCRTITSTLANQFNREDFN
ncbi:MAG: PDZ domain-containing protein [Bdellovibrio sp.]|nr:PDZ domain-containing protein [Bdellovibrio sp.]